MPKRSEAHDKDDPTGDHHHGHCVRQMHRLAETDTGEQLRVCVWRDARICCMHMLHKHTRMHSRVPVYTQAIRSLDIERRQTAKAQLHSSNTASRNQRHSFGWLYVSYCGKWPPLCPGVLNAILGPKHMALLDKVLAAKPSDC